LFDSVDPIDPVELVDERQKEREKEKEKEKIGRASCRERVY
jgi:hypothetical protein